MAALAVSAAAVAASIGAAAQAQTASEPDRRPIFVYGERQSAIKAIAPLATLDSHAIGAPARPPWSELLQAIRPLTQSASGEDPIFLLNGQRTSGYQEIGSLPPEAIDKVEVLPEPAALRFGYPPTRRVLNFITKRNFGRSRRKRSSARRRTLGSTTANANLNLTRLHKDQRFTLALESRHTSSLYQSERHLVPDPDVLFDAIGNVTGLNGGEIDPALSAAAGQTVTVAPVPGDAALRRASAPMPARPTRPRCSTMGPYRTLRRRRPAPGRSKASLPTGSAAHFGVAQPHRRAQQRPPLPRPGSRHADRPGSQPLLPHSPAPSCSSDTSPKRRRSTYGRRPRRCTAAAPCRGVTAGWRWDLTATADQKLVSGSSDFGIDPTAANAAIANGANPFAPLDAPARWPVIRPRASADAHIGHQAGRQPTRRLRCRRGGDAPHRHAEAERIMANSGHAGSRPFDLRLARTPNAKLARRSTCR